MKLVSEILPFLKAPRRIRTLGDALASIMAEWSSQPRELRTRNSPQLYQQRRVGEFLTEILGADEQSILLAEVVDMEGDVIRHGLNRGLSRVHARQYVCSLRKILTHARACNWNCRTMAVRESWQLIEAALRREGCLQIVQYAAGRRLTPRKMREVHMMAWKQSAIAGGLSLGAAEDRDKRFRGKIRRAGLAHLFPHLKLQPKKAPSFILSRCEIPKAIQAELADILAFKTADWVPARRYRSAVSASTSEIIDRRFRQLLGFVFHAFGMADVSTLLQIVTEPIISEYITFLENNRGLLRQSVGHYIMPIHAVVREHPLFRGRNYGWILERLKTVPKENPQKREERKEGKFVPFPELASIPGKLHALSQQPNLCAVKIAWYRHDELFWTLLLHLPLRLRNLRECGIQQPANINLFFEKINPRMQNDLKLPDWLQAALTANPVQKFWILRFQENAMKSRRAETKFVPSPVIPILLDYLAVHRCHLVRPGRDPGTLFLSRRREPLSSEAARRIVTQLSREYSKRICPHLVRDVVADDCLKRGGSIEDVQDKLCHINFETSWIYSRLNNTERGIEALNQHFSSSEGSDLT